MRDDTLLTLKQLADQLGLPESTVRYYRDAFLDHIPSVGTGRRRRYPVQAVAVLRSIAKQYASGTPRADILRAVEGSGRSAPVTVASKPAPAARAIEDVSNIDLLAAILDGEREQRDALWQMAKEIVRLADVLERQDGVLTEIAAQAGVGADGNTLPAADSPKARITAAPANRTPVTPPRVDPVRAAVETAQPNASAPPPAVPAAPAATAAATPGDAPAARMAAMDTPVAEPASPPGPRASWASSPGPLAQAAAPESPPPSAPPVVPPAPPVVPVSAAPMGSRVAATADPAATGQARTTSPYNSSEIDQLRQALESERELVERLRESKLRLEHRVTDAESQLEETRRPRRSSVIGRLLGGNNG